jgi:polyisoprenoid-binding protein YceI
MGWNSFRPVGLALALGLGTGSTAHAEQYAVDASASEVKISVGRSGLFSFAGHPHDVTAPKLAGEVVADAADVARSSVRLVFEAGALTVSATGEPEGDAPRVQAKMLGPDVLDAARFPEVTFQSTAVEGRLVPDGSWNLRVTGDVTLKGQTRSLVLPLRVHVAAGVLTATGSFVLKQSEFGISPVSVGGVVKVKNELGIDYKIVARSAP